MSGEAWALGYREYISVKQQVSIQVSNTASIVEKRCQKIHAALLSVGSNFEIFFYISLGLSLVCFTLLQEFWILVIQTFETLTPESVAYTVIVVQRCVGRCIGRKSHEISEIIISFYWSAALKYKMFSYRAAGSVYHITRATCGKLSFSYILDYFTEWLKHTSQGSVISSQS